MRRDRTFNKETENYATGFPLLVIGTTMAAMTAYLIIGSSVMTAPQRSTRVYVQLIDIEQHNPSR